MKNESDSNVTCPYCKAVYKKSEYDNLKTDASNFKICARCYGSFKVTRYIVGDVNWSGNSITVSTLF